MSAARGDQGLTLEGRARSDGVIVFQRSGSGQLRCLCWAAVEDITHGSTKMPFLSDFFNRAEGSIQRRGDSTPSGDSLLVFERFCLQLIGPSNQIRPKSLSSKLNHFTTLAFPGCLPGLKDLLQSSNHHPR